MIAGLADLPVGALEIVDTGETSGRRVGRNALGDGFVVVVPAVVLDAQQAVLRGQWPPAVIPPTLVDQRQAVQVGARFGRGDDEARHFGGDAGIASVVVEDAAKATLHAPGRVRQVMPVEPGAVVAAERHGALERCVVRVIQCVDHAA